MEKPVEQRLYGGTQHQRRTVIILDKLVVPRVDLKSRQQNGRHYPTEM